MRKSILLLLFLLILLLIGTSRANYNIIRSTPIDGEGIAYNSYNNMIYISYYNGAGVPYIKEYYVNNFTYTGFSRNAYGWSSTGGMQLDYDYINNYIIEGDNYLDVGGVTGRLSRDNLSGGTTQSCVGTEELLASRTMSGVGYDPTTSKLYYKPSAVGSTIKYISVDWVNNSCNSKTTFISGLSNNYRGIDFNKKNIYVTSSNPASVIIYNQSGNQIDNQIINGLGSILIYDLEAYPQNNSFFILGDLNLYEIISDNSNPIITSYGNNYTNNLNTSIIIQNVSDASILFNLTSNQTELHYNWFKNGIDQNTDFDNISFDLIGNNTIIANAYNYNGTSQNITWTVNINQSLYDVDGYIQFVDVNSSIYDLENSYIFINSVYYNYSNSSGYYKINDVPIGTYTIRASKNDAFNAQSYSIVVSNSPVTQNFTLYYSHPSMTYPNRTGNFFYSEYSNSVLPIKYWSNPYFAWGKYNYNSSNTTQACVISTGNTFRCNVLTGDYIFNISFSDIYNYNLDLYHPFLTGHRIFYTADYNNYNNSEIVGNVAKPISSMANKESYLRGVIFNLAFIMFLILGYIYYKGFAEKPKGRRVILWK